MSDLRIPIHMPAVKMDIVGDKVVKRCGGKPLHEQTISFKTTVENPFQAQELLMSKLSLEIAGLDETSELENPDWNWQVPSLQAKQPWSKTKGEVSVSKLSCGTHDIIATWDMDEFAETTDATGWASFRIDCSNCTGTDTDVDESLEVRPTGPGPQAVAAVPAPISVPVGPTTDGPKNKVPGPTHAST